MNEGGKNGVAMNEGGKNGGKNGAAMNEGGKNGDATQDGSAGAEPCW